MLARELIAKVSRFVGNLSRTGYVPYRLESRVVEYLGCSIHYQCPQLWGRGKEAPLQRSPQLESGDIRVSAS